MTTREDRHSVADATPQATALDRIARRKRPFDVAAIVLLSPLLVAIGVVAWVGVRVALGCPALFRQPRTGLHAATFQLLKFRSMTDERDATGALLPDAARLTRAGRILRRTSIDELPQLFNVLRGDMSLVGPRPLLPRYLPYYTPQERHRHDVRPGITGLAQVSGRNAVSWDERLKLDVRYVESMSLRGDLRILGRTLLQAVGGRGTIAVAGLSGDPLDVERSFPRLDGFGMRSFSIRDIQDRVEWMNHGATARNMRLPEGVTEESTIRWLEQTHADPSRRDFVVFDIASGRNVAMMGLRRTQSEVLPEFYLFVDPERHGQGLGQISMRLLFHWLRTSHAYEGCRLSVAVANRSAVRLYERFGFAETSRAAGRITMQLDAVDWVES